MLVISSARRGISLMDLRTREVMWEKAPERGAPTSPIVTETGTVLYGETQGSLLALSLANGREVARAEGGAGFRDVQTSVYRDLEYGYLGPAQVLFLARR